MLHSIKHKKQELKHLPLFPTIAGIDYKQEPVNRPKGFASYQFFFCKKGEGELHLNGRKMIIKEGQSMFIQANEGHKYFSPQNNWIIDLIAFSGNCATDILRNMGLHETAVFNLNQSFDFSSYVQEIADTASAPEQSKIVYSFLLDYTTNVEKVQDYLPVQDNPVVQNVIGFLEDNYARIITLDEIAKEVGLSKEYLCSVFKREVGQTIIQFLTTLRISHARQYLVEYPEKRITEIAGMCGFENASYFGKVFRETVGTSPDRYRDGTKRV